MCRVPFYHTLILIITATCHNPSSLPRVCFLHSKYGVSPSSVSVAGKHPSFSYLKHNSISLPTLPIYLSVSRTCMNQLHSSDNSLHQSHTIYSFIHTIPTFLPSHPVTASPSLFLSKQPYNVRMILVHLQSIIHTNLISL